MFRIFHSKVYWYWPQLAGKKVLFLKCISRQTLFLCRVPAPDQNVASVLKVFSNSETNIYRFKTDVFTKTRSSAVKDMFTILAGSLGQVYRFSN